MGWQTELKEIYRELEGDLSRRAPECKARGLCCHFEDFGHVLFASSLEANYLRRKAGPPKVPIKKEVCPYLVDNLCTAREHRTLGCRVFFCQKDWLSTSQDLYETYYRRIKQLAKKYRPLEWRYAPLVELLKEEGTEEAFERWAIEDR
ncbi:MAG TPA: hypothetical protein ACFYED_06475 [Candidatus Tripitaka californicus]|uniref:hypothetical protein n=1 Tax=Candidatus Tripitaka californicus TaxID=3367616 RepID=UPI0040295F73|nr:hypothetical protein [Planctomycetota bacterium]